MHGKCGRLVRNVPMVLISSNLLANDASAGTAELDGSLLAFVSVLGVSGAALLVRKESQK